MSKTNKSRVGLIILILLIVVVILLLVLFPESKKIDFQQFNLDFPSQHKPIFGKYVAVVSLEGAIQERGKTYNHSWLLSKIYDLKNDKKNYGLILSIDSPGGTVYHTDEIYLALLDYKKTGKKLYAYIETIGASGGYYIACAADCIIANRNSLCGSIGVISGQSFDLTELMERYGVKMNTITAGRNKNMLNINEPLSSEQKEIMQSVANEAYEQFVDIVATSRKKTLAEIEELADGRIYTAKQAVENGLIDKIGTTIEAVLQMQREIKTEKNITDLDSEYFSVDESFSFMDFVTDSIDSIKSKNTSGADATTQAILDLVSTKILPEGIEYPAYYYAK